MHMQVLQCGPIIFINLYAVGTSMIVLLFQYGTGANTLKYSYRTSEMSKLEPTVWFASFVGSGDYDFELCTKDTS